jgi:hypothetical protein
MRLRPPRIAVAATLATMAAACGGAAAPETNGPTAGATPTSDPASTQPAGSTPAATPPPGGEGPDTGAPAAPGEGRLEVGGAVYSFTIDECDFTTDGPTAGSFEVSGTTADGSTFEMVQFFLGGNWSQTSVDLDDPGSKRVYVIRNRAAEGAQPASIDGTNVTWVETYFELDEAANSQTSIGEGVVNLTCAA